MTTEQPKPLPTEHLKAMHLSSALRGYIHNGVLQVLDAQGNAITCVSDVSLSQPIKASFGRTPTMATITAPINLYNTREEAISGVRTVTEIKQDKEEEPMDEEL